MYIYHGVKPDSYLLYRCSKDMYIRILNLYNYYFQPYIFSYICLAL